MQRILYLLIVLLMIPATASARKSKKTAARVEHRLSPEEQLRFDALYMEAIALEQCGQTDQAVMLMQRALEIDPRSAPALYFLSDAARAMKQDVKALNLIRKAEAIDTMTYWYGEAEAVLLMNLHQPQEAMKTYRRLADRFPEKSEPLYSVAELYMRADSLHLALETLNRLEELEGVDPRFSLQKFYILQRMGLPDSAFAEFDRLIARHPYNMQYRIQMGDLQMQFGRIPQAKETYDEAARIEPDNAYLWIAQANYLAITGDQRASDSLIHEALINANLDAETKVKLLTEYLKQQFRYEQQNRSEVDSLFHIVEQLHPSEPEIYSLHADYLSAIERDSLAAEQMSFAVDINPTNETYWAKYIACAIRSEALDEALRISRKCSQVLPDFAEAYRLRAFVYYRREQQDSVLWAYREALKRIDPKEVNQISQYWGSMGDAYHQLGKQDSAYLAYDEALKYNKENYMVLNNYAYFLSVENRDLYRAEQMSLKVVQKYPDNATYLDTYAWILYQQGSYMLARFYQQKAIDALSAADEEEGGGATLYEHMGDILAKENNLKEAVEYWKKAVERDDCANKAEIRQKIDVAEAALKLMN